MTGNSFNGFTGHLTEFGKTKTVSKAGNLVVPN